MRIKLPHELFADSSRVCGLVLIGLLAPLSASAALGGDVSSVQTDQIQFRGMVRSAGIGPYTVYEITASTGTVIKEYISQGGKVFAVTWRGPWLPDMQQLLGSYFERYVEAARVEAPAHAGRKPLQIVQPDFVLQMSGHMRSFAGKAFLPEMLPANLKAEDIQ